MLPRLHHLIMPLLTGVFLTGVILVAQQPAPPPVSAAASTSPPPGNGSVVPAIPAARDGSVWGALVYASAAKPDKETPVDPKEFPNLSRRLAKAFPYERFQVIGQHTQVVFREYESWVVPSRDVFLKLDSKGATLDGGLNLHIQFWQGQQVLVKTDTVLRPDSPLFIGGPKWRDGQLIFVLDLQKDDAKPAK